MRDFFHRLGRFLIKTLELIARFIAGRIITSLVVGVLSYAFFFFLDLRYSVIMAVLFGLLNLIPAVGGIVGIIVCSIIALIQKPIFGLYTLLFLFLLQQVETFLISPVIIGKSVNLKPLLAMGAIILGGALFGLPGILLAVPVAAIIKLAITIFGGEPSSKPPISEKLTDEKPTGKSP